MENPTQKLKSFYSQSIRVWKILKKPTNQEFQLVAKVSAIGILVIGLVGFLVALAMNPFV